MYEREALLSDLKQHVCEIHFTKVNGDARVMRCTLQRDFLPKDFNTEEIDVEHKKPQNLEVIVVWDVHQKGWRSFRVESVQYAQIIDGY